MLHLENMQENNFTMVLQVFEMGGQIQAKGSLHEPTLIYHFGLDLVVVAQTQILHIF
jgi:hypothetical protein